MDDRWLSIVSLSACLILVLSGLASYRLSLKKGVTMALIWVAIFAGLTGLITAIRG